MKTSIIIEDGRISIQIDDGKTVSVPSSSGTLPAPVEPEPPVVEAKKTEPASESVIPDKLVSVVPVNDKPGRTCQICGDDITGLSRVAKICRRPECKRARQAQYVDKSSAKGKSKEQSVSYCRYCKAWTTHDSSNHAVVASSLLKLEERTEGEPWSPKVSDLPEGATPVTHEPDAAPYLFEDRWNCDACRRRSATCPFHISMEEDGKKPEDEKRRNAGTAW